MNRNASLTLALAAAAALTACGDRVVQNITAPVTAARVKFFNFSVGSPGVNFYANDAKITAIGSTLCSPPADTSTVCKTTGSEAVTGTAYTAVGNAGLYNQIPAGSVTFTGKIAVPTDKGLAITTLASQVDNNKYYSFYLSGAYDAASKKTDSFIIEDAIPDTPDYTQAYVRFVNAISNSSPMTLFAKNTTTTTESAIGGTIAYKSAGAFTAVAGGLYDLSTRTAGSSTNVITVTGVGFSPGHVYTIAARGTIGSTVTANQPALNNTANR
jgi:hypothetical protein